MKELPNAARLVGFLVGCSMQGSIDMEVRNAQCRNAADFNEFIEGLVGTREVWDSGAHNFTDVL